MGFIYQILNAANEKRYIGRTVNLKSRKHQHFCALRNNKHHSPHLQYAWNKYGEGYFLFEVLEECSNEVLASREKYWIDYYQSGKGEYGYNMDDVMEGNFIKSESSRAKTSTSIRKSTEGYIVYYADTGVSLKVPTISKAGEILNIKRVKKFNKVARVMCCLESEFDSLVEEFKRYIDEPSSAKQVFLFTKDGLFAAVCDSQSQVAKHLGVSEDRVRQVLKGEGKIIKGHLLSYTNKCPSYKKRESKGPYKTKKNPTGVKVPKTKPYRYILTTPEGEQIFLYRGSDAINYIPGATKKGVNKLVVGERKSYFNYTCTSTKV